MEGGEEWWVEGKHGAGEEVERFDTWFASFLLAVNLGPVQRRMARASLSHCCALSKAARVRVVLSTSPKWV